MNTTISIKVDAEKDGTFTTHMMVSGLTSFAMANAASDHMQRLFCGEKIELTDRPAPSGREPSEVEKLMDAAGLCRRCAAQKE